MGNVEEKDVASVPSAKKKKTAIVAGVVAAVVIAAGAGFFVWHEQPSFCNAICHTPMDASVETLVDGSHDKFGNELTSESQKMAMLAYSHAHNEKEQVACLDCHVPTIQEQVTESIHWVTGDYFVAGENKIGQTILESRTLSDLGKARGLEGDEFCLNEACHTNDDGSVMTREDLAALTAEEFGERNPHSGQHGALSCDTCHKAHSQSVNYCSDCHEDAKIPDGWVSAKDYDALSSME